MPTTSIIDFREVVCQNPKCTFEGMIRVFIDAHEMIGDCRRCGCEIIIDLAD